MTIAKLPHADPRHEEHRRQRMQVLVIATIYIIGSIQNVSITSLGASEFKGIHAIVLVCILPTALRTPSFPPTLKPLAIYLGYAIFGSIVAYIFNGYNSLLLNYGFALVLLFVLANLGRNTTYRTAVRGLMLGASLTLAYVSINVMAHLDQVKMAQELAVQTGARPQLEGMLYAGGLNLEATWVALGTVFFIGRPKLFWLYSIPALFVCLSLSSRTAIIIWVISLIFFLIVAKRKALFVAALSSLTILGLFMVESLGAVVANVNVIQRFTSIGNEPGSVGRQTLWDYAFEAVGRNPWLGYGVGNEVNAITLAGGPAFTEDNVHNLYLGSVLALGIPGLVIFITCMVLFWIRLSGRPEARAYLFAYLIAGAVEFRGADTIFLLAVGILAASSFDRDCSIQPTAIGPAQQSKLR